MVGPSGSGKSTLALAIAGLVPHEVPGEWLGSLCVDGLETSQVPRVELAARVGIVFQDPESQLVMDRVEDDVAFGLESRGWERGAMLGRVPQALASVGLDGFERRRTTTLSGGEQQRLALAGVLAPEPGVVVLDEPTANLDPAGTAAVFERIAALRAAERTLVVVEHRVDRAWPLADLVLALGEDGVPIDVGAPDAVLARSAATMRAAGIWLPGDRSTAAVRSWATAGIATRHEPAAPATPGAQEPPLSTAREVEFGYRRDTPVVHGIDLDVRAGERTVLVGPNGSGKSTLARLLVGLLRPDRGRVRLAGRDPAALPARELSRWAGYVFQDPERQFLANTVEREVMLGLAPTALERVAELMTALRLPLERFGDRSPYRLSGGEQRRLSLAAALVRRPALLVLDEPTFGQDRHGYEGLLALLDERVDAGVAVVAATHDERFVADFARRTLVLDAGRLVGDTHRDGSAATVGAATLRAGAAP